jgi:hypothetical protein
MSRIDRALIGFLLLLVAGVVTVEIGRTSHAAAPEDWQAAAQHILEHKTPTDTVLLNNAGDTEGLASLRKAGLHPLLSLPEPRGRVRSLWLVGRRADAPAGLNGWQAGETTAFSAVTVRSFLRSNGSDILWQAANNLGQASLSLDGKACRISDRQGLRCAGAPDWMHVSQESHSVGGAERTCLWAHPASDNRPLTLSWGAVPDGELTFGHGLTDHAARSNNSSPVVVTVRSAGHTHTFEATNRSGWKEYQVRTGGGLSISLRAARDGQRHHCLAAAIR